MPLASKLRKRFLKLTALHKFCYEICARWLNMPASFESKQPTDWKTGVVVFCRRHRRCLLGVQFSLEKSSQLGRHFPSLCNGCCCWLASGMTIKIYDCFYEFTRFLCGLLWRCSPPTHWPPPPVFCSCCNLTLMSVKVDSLILANGVIVHHNEHSSVGWVYAHSLRENFIRPNTLVEWLA